MINMMANKLKNIFIFNKDKQLSNLELVFYIPRYVGMYNVSKCHRIKCASIENSIWTCTKVPTYIKLHSVKCKCKSSHIVYTFQKREEKNYEVVVKNSS